MKGTNLLRFVVQTLRVILALALLAFAPMPVSAHPMAVPHAMSAPHAPHADHASCAMLCIGWPNQAVVLGVDRPRTSVLDTQVPPPLPLPKGISFPLIERPPKPASHV